MNIGASNGLISRAIKNRTDISAEWLSKIINAFPYINTTWLLTGEGEMLHSVVGEAENIFQTKTTENVLKKNEDTFEDTFEDKRKLQKTSSNDEAGHSDNFKTKTTENVTLSEGDAKDDAKGNFPKLQKTSPFVSVANIASDITVTHDAGGEDIMDSERGIKRDEMIPVYDVTMFLNLSKLLANEYRPTSYMYLPNLRKCDGATLMPGDSMEPEIKRGDLIVYRKVRNKDTGLFLGQIYLLSCELEGEVHVTVRYILKSENEGYVQLASANKHYPPKDVPLEAIKELAMIKASVRYNTMV